MEDGGYYALKGFDFQIDKTIIEIFSTVLDTEDVCIEKIQDINSNSFVTQVKYKETQTYSASKIRDPVVQLISEFSETTTPRTYILYCFFSDQQEHVKTFNSEELEEVLEIKLHKNCSESHQKKYDIIKKIPSTVKSSFALSFQLIFAPDHTTQFERALKLIAEQPFCNSTAEASFYYCYLADHLRRLVITNKDPELRTCSRKKLTLFITNQKHQLFYSTLNYLKGRKALLQTLKKHFKKPLNHQNVVFLIGSKLATETFQLTTLITSIIQQQFNNPNHDVHPPTFVINHESITDIKKGLLDNNITFNDGYEAIQFSPNQFNRRHLSLRKTSSYGRALDSLGNISYKMRISTLNNFQASLSTWERPDRAYYFDIDILSEYTDIPCFQINDLSCDEIWLLIKR